MSARLYNRLALIHLAATVTALLLMGVALQQGSTALFAVSWMIYGVTSLVIGAIGIRQWRAAIQDPQRIHTPSRLDATVRIAAGSVLVAFAVALIVSQNT